MPTEEETMAKAKKKSTKKKATKKAAKKKGKASAAPPEMKGDPQIIEMLNQIAASVFKGDTIGMVVIPVNKNGTASEVLFSGSTPPAALALPTLALQQGLVEQARQAAEKQQALQQALMEAKKQGLVKEVK